MSIFCLFGRHRPSLSSIKRKGSGGYSGICESCARPLERQHDSRWTASEPLDSGVRQPAA